MYNVKSMVIQNTMEKVADHELPKDASQWQQEILKQFFEKFQSIPPQFSIDAVISNQDENRGYAKGSVVVGTLGKQINFPVIIRNFMLSPFDVFISSLTAGKPKYYAATMDNIQTELLTTEYGTPTVGPYSSYDESISLKRPGGIPAKVPVVSEDISKFSSAPSGSGWKHHISKSDKASFMKKLADNPELPDYFEYNSGNVLKEVIDMPTEVACVPSNHAQGTIDYSDVIQAKQAVTVVDTMIFDPNNLVPIKPGSIAELRTEKFPSMEEFLETGDNTALGKLKTDMGQPIVGLVVHVEGDDSWQSDHNFFIDARGGQYCVSGQSRTPHPNDRSIADTDTFYGTDVSNDPKVADAVVDMLRSVRQIYAMSRPEYDKGFVERNYSGYACAPLSGINSTDKPDLNAGLLVIYKESGKYQAYKPYGDLFRKAIVNGSSVYIDDRQSSAVVTTNIAKPTLVSKIGAPEYIPVVGNKAHILLIPHDAVVLNLCFMRQIDYDDILKPSDNIRQKLVDSRVGSVKVASVDGKITLSGESVVPLYTVMGMDKNAGLEPSDALSVLQICGVSKENAIYAMEKAASGTAATIFGTRSDYISDRAYRNIEKTAAIKDVLGDAAVMLKKDLIKEASLIQDQDSVDALLSLNFINRENLMSYIEDIPKFDAVTQRLCSLIVASRMGLQQIDEAAVKSAIEGLDQVTKGLIEIKTSLGV